jgi:hypothetical protein
MPVFDAEFSPYLFGNCDLSLTGNGNPANKLIALNNLFLIGHVTIIISKNNLVNLTF